ncbi:hypothetical protein BXY70_1312 [Roseovarius halotolerans]|uniref:Uncharacterized protein n=1 Tax=Roseovarius halotolerans TaxID=505353 RepID=A0A1X6Y7J2_9RHOB|nr:hypothetical protein [Roseovarius halotolerans]RKT35279.1 hypothetical protein BXY70_1312 [Roseovarius halotolerans]SLN11310.1 hypothetical protein ROH8110_00084 [Roseovarius halotolerans]
MIAFLRTLGLGKWIALGGLVALIAGAFWLQSERLDRAQGALEEAHEDLEIERAARTRAEDAVTSAVERAERLAAARDAARRRLADRLAAVEAAKGECLETELPAGLLD